MNGDFSGKWDAMTVSERIDHLLADWKTIRGTSDPLILQVAASVAHHVLKQAKSEIEQLRLCGEERVANLRSYDAELREQVKQLRVEALGTQRRIQDQDAIMAELWERIHAITAERDEARRDWCNLESLEWDEPTKTPQIIAKERGWDCFKEDGK
jgi:hypothetical protein